MEIKQKSKSERKDLRASELVLHLKGKLVNASTVNALRLVSMLNVPSYALCTESINIEFNDSIFNSDQMRTRLHQLVLPKIDVPCTLLPDKYWRGIDFSDPERERSPDDTKNIQVIINAHNDTTENIDVTTNDLRFIEDGEEIPNKYHRKFPHLLIQLRPTEVFNCTAKAVLATGERHDAFSPVAQCFLRQQGSNEYEFVMRSIGQLDEYEILVKAARILVKKLQDLKQQIESLAKKRQTDEKRLDIEIENEEHAIGNLLARMLQDRDEVVYAASGTPDHLVKAIRMKIVSKSDPLTSVFKAIDDSIKLYQQVDASLMKLGKTFVGKYVK